MMTLDQIRMKQNPILTSLLLGMGQGTMIAERLFPRLPSALSSVVLAKLGKERLRRYDLRRAPGAKTKRVDIKFEGKVYTVDQYSVEVPMPRELLREADESKRLQVGNYLEVSAIAMTTVTGSNSSWPKVTGVAVVTSENPVCNAPFSGRACGMAIPSSITMAAPKSSYTVSISLTYSALQIWRLASNEPASSMASSAREIFCLRAINDGSKIISILSS